MGYSDQTISRVASFFHALITSNIALYILLTRDSSVLHNPGNFVDPLWSIMFALTSIYLSVDLILMLVMPSKNDMLWIFHHIVGGLGIFWMWQINRAWLLGLLFELTEMSTIFLNCTWYYIHFKKKPDIFFYLASLGLLSTFFVTRWAGGVYMWYYVLRNTTFWLQNMNLFENLYIFVGTAVITFLNVKWGLQLVAKLLEQVKKRP